MSQALSDPDYSVAVRAVKLRRKVEMYQWIEHKKTRYMNVIWNPEFLKPKSRKAKNYFENRCALKIKVKNVS